ncbi:MAG: hypothetical protein LW807_06660 [Proteobacteria bacterium]|nr:hypothetical protein [Pseudomonadota bacterium]
MKKVLWTLSFILFSAICYAADASIADIPQLNKTLSTGQTLLKVVAKVGGIAVLVVAGFIFATGKAKGEAIGIMFYVLIGLGIVASAFGWWDTIFTSGFAF